MIRYQPHGHTVLNIHDELPLLPEHLLEAFDLREELDHVRADLPNGPHLVEPSVRSGLATRDEGAEAQDF